MLADADKILLAIRQGGRTVYLKDINGDVVSLPVFIRLGGDYFFQLETNGVLTYILGSGGYSIVIKGYVRKRKKIIDHAVIKIYGVELNNDILVLSSFNRGFSEALSEGLMIMSILSNKKIISKELKDITQSDEILGKLKEKCYENNIKFSRKDLNNILSSIITIYGINIGNIYAKDVQSLLSNPPFVVMEYCDKGDLTKFIDQKPILDINKFVDFIGNIISAVAYIHTANIAHRDIKPDNIFIRSYKKEYMPKLADFSISLYLDKNNQYIWQIGTPQYMPPEYLMFKSKASTTADIYSLGVTFFEVFTGDIPSISKILLCISKNPLISDEIREYFIQDLIDVLSVELFMRANEQLLMKKLNDISSVLSNKETFKNEQALEELAKNIYEEKIFHRLIEYDKKRLYESIYDYLDQMYKKGVFSKKTISKELRKALATLFTDIITKSYELSVNKRYKDGVELLIDYRSKLRQII